MRTFPCLLSIPLLVVIGMLYGCALDPLTDAAHRGDSQTVRVLLDQGHAGDINEALIDSACNGHAEVAQLLLDRGANVNYFRRRHTYDDEGLGGQFNSLECAAFYGRPEMVSLLLNSGANRDHKTTHGTTALDLAKKQGRTSVVKLLEEAQGSPTARPPQRPALLPSTKESPPPPIY